MADEAGEVAPSPPKKSGGMMGMLVNGLGIFVLTLGAVIAGGAINATLHPLPDFKLDKDGKITAIVPVPPPSEHGDGEGRASLFYAIDPHWSKILKTVPPCASCRSRWKSWAGTRR